jgi:predicted HTH transcriptional regulator
MFMEADELGLRSPDIEEIGMRVRFTIWLKENIEIAKEDLLDKERPESRPELPFESKLAEKIIIILSEKESGKSEIATDLGHKTVSGELKKQITNLLEEGFIEMTIPEKPNSSKQKYRLTKKGKDLLDN